MLLQVVNRFTGRNVPNPDAAVDALRISNDRILLAFNDSAVHRENLRLAVSRSHEMHWTRIATLESGPKGEFSYPFMIRTQDGRIHLVYTWNRKRIKHVTFNESWIDLKLKQSGG